MVVKLVILFNVFACCNCLFLNGYTCYGDINGLSPSGTQDGGVAGSNNAIDEDISELNAKKSCYIQAGRENLLEICVYAIMDVLSMAQSTQGIQPALIGALASRESRAGRLLQRTRGYSDNAYAYGILQCDVRYHSFCLNYPWDSCDHINMMVREVLGLSIKQVQQTHPNWSREQQLQGGVAAYNSGVSNVQTWERIDEGTANGDYSNDVIARAQRLMDEWHW